MSGSSPKEITRRGFITRVGQGLVAANLAETFLKSAAAELQVPDPPGKKLGWAVVGLGNLAIHEIFARLCKMREVQTGACCPD